MALTQSATKENSVSNAKEVNNGEKSIRANQRGDEKQTRAGWLQRREAQETLMIVKEREPTKRLFDYQAKLVDTLIRNPQKSVIVMDCGLGKGPSSIVWAYRKCKMTSKNKVLVITTSSKVHVKDSLKRNDFEQDADAFVPGFRDEFLLETVSWDSLHKWVVAHKGELGQWVYIADEIFKAKNPTSRRSRAFQAIAKATSDWTGYTATPGQVWIDFLGYFIATGFVKNKTCFMRRFCRIQTFKGFVEIVGYNEERTLKNWWERISYAPDAREALQELPKANYDLVYTSKPKGYSKVLKMRQKLCSDGELSEDYEDFIDNPSALTNYLRRLCWNEKRQWMSDYLEGLGTNCVIFYNYTDTGNEIEEIAKKVLPKEAKVWRIDGSHHQIPTTDTLGEYDIVLAQWQSGGEGLNLQMITQMVMVEPTYSYVIWHQAKKRIHRIGQDRPVFYHALFAKGTIEEDILECIKGKRDFAENTWLISNKLIKEEDS